MRQTSAPRSAPGRDRLQRHDADRLPRQLRVPGADEPGQWFHPSGYGTLGFALPAALGAKIAMPGARRLALAGDFGLQFTVQRTHDRGREGISLPIVVWNNSALGQIRDDMVAAGIAQLGVIARNPDFVALARSLRGGGLPGARRERAHRGNTHALSHAGPTLIEVVAASSFSSCYHNVDNQGDDMKITSCLAALAATLLTLPALAAEQIKVVERPVGETTVDLGAQRRFDRRPAGIRQRRIRRREQGSDRIRSGLLRAHRSSARAGNACGRCC
jgi:hypothetical protein